MDLTSTIPLEVAERLERLGIAKTRAWWERYLKGEAEFRGVPMAQVRAVTRELWEKHSLEQRSISQLLRIALACMSAGPTEDKLVGILLLAEHSLPRLERRHVPRLAKPLADGSLADWNSVDWYCVKCLGPYLTAGADTEERSRAIAAWRSAKGLWQRRASAVAFVHHVAEPEELWDGFHALILEVCEHNVRDDTRWSQTSVGWLLRELSRHHPALTLGFVEDHPELSREARKNALKYIEQS